MLEVKNLHANVNGKEILKGINLSVKAGEVHAIMGPNGSGKSTLSSVLVGNPAFEVTEGEVIFNGKNLLDLSPEDRSREGIFLSFQYPVEIPGVSMVNFMRAALNEHRKYNGLEPVSATDFLKLMREKRAIVELDNKLASRSVNEGFSGGEKKRNEIFQMAMLEPKLAILDETDSGLDIDALRIVAHGVNQLRTPENAAIVITHYQRLLDYIKPDVVHVLYNWPWNWKRKVTTGSRKRWEMSNMKAEQQYIDLFAQCEDLVCRHSTPVMNALRADALANFERLGFPSTRSEDYKYTDVAQAFAPDYGLNINRVAIPVNPYDVFRCDVPNLSTSLYFVVNDTFYDKELPKTHLPEGVYAGGLKAFTEQYPEIASKYYGKAAPSSKDGIIALNTMLAQDGFVVYVPKNVVVERPIQLVNIFRSDVDTMANRRVLVIMEPHSEAKLLVCDHSIDDVKFLATQVVEIFAEEGARFDYYDLEESSESTTRFSSVHVKQAASTNVLVNGITLTNGLTRNNYYVELNGEYAESTLCGMSVLDKEQQMDTYSHITHAVPNCTSNELFKNVLNDHAVGVFSGRILVKEDAQKTAAYQTNRNLCATREARMYSKPQLEIYADDVKCSHGMTTGQLDENALFYMQSRGIPRDEARMLLSVAFTSDVIDHVRLEALKDRLHKLVEKRFRGELAKCAGCRICK